jgi:putative transposase
MAPSTEISLCRRTGRSGSSALLPNRITRPGQCQADKPADAEFVICDQSIDITYIRTRSGWLYLAAVLDLYSRKVIGWAMAPTMPAELVCTALQMAIAQRQPSAGLIVHSDRGSQYASAAYQALLAQHGLCCSMSRKGNCWDNAVMERFFLNLKMERVWRNDYANHAEAMRDVTDYIVAFYNAVRLHSTLGNLAPAAFERERKTTKEKLMSVSENS